MKAGSADLAGAGVSKRPQLSAESLGPHHFPALERAPPVGSRSEQGRGGRGERGGQERGGKRERQSLRVVARLSQRAQGLKEKKESPGHDNEGLRVDVAQETTNKVFLLFLSICKYYHNLSLLE